VASLRGYVPPSGPARGAPCGLAGPGAGLRRPPRGLGPRPGPPSSLAQAPRRASPAGPAPPAQAPPPPRPPPAPRRGWRHGTGPPAGARATSRHAAPRCRGVAGLGAARPAAGRHPAGTPRRGRAGQGTRPTAGGFPRGTTPRAAPGNSQSHVPSSRRSGATAWMTGRGKPAPWTSAPKAITPTGSRQWKNASKPAPAAHRSPPLTTGVRDRRRARRVSSRRATSPHTRAATCSGLA
jgi:hypothetical protein